MTSARPQVGICGIGIELRNGNLTPKISFSKNRIEPSSFIKTSFIETKLPVFKENFMEFVRQPVRVVIVPAVYSISG
jgi:hypothetical protein